MTTSNDRASFAEQVQERDKNFGPVLRERDDLVELARTLGVRPDWHEPDEQNLTAVFHGTPGMFDNAMPTAMGFGNGGEYAEMFVTLHYFSDEYDEEVGRQAVGAPVASVNLATLFAWAAEADHSMNHDEEIAKRDRVIARLQEQLRLVRNAVGGRS